MEFRVKNSFLFSISFQDVIELIPYTVKKEMANRGFFYFLFIKIKWRLKK